DASGYLVDIGVVDTAVRSLVAPRLAAAAAREVAGGQATDVVGLLGELREPLQAVLPAPLHRLAYRPSPFRSFTLEWSMPTRALISETFEFAASHRLHLAGLSAEENARLFGKCNNPNGHGHNYRIEVAVRVDPAADPAVRFGFEALARIVRDEIMGRFDHRHLNLDCPEFAQLNPSVEHIALVCHELLSAPVRGAGGELDHVRVWETDKTSCRYPA
ncbi:MAG: 6-carboxytetrahydropterin synthase, partial [Planctomycetota bacterium]